MSDIICPHCNHEQEIEACDLNFLDHYTQAELKTNCENCSYPLQIWGDVSIKLKVLKPNKIIAKIDYDDGYISCKKGDFLLTHSIKGGDSTKVNDIKCSSVYIYKDLYVIVSDKLIGVLADPEIWEFQDADNE